MRWLPQTSGYSYPRVAMIWIDVHPVGENPTNTPHTLHTSVHVHPAYASYGQSLYMVTFHESSTELSKPTAQEKKGSRHNPQRATDRFVGPYLASLLSQYAIYQRPATTLTSPISPVCYRYVQYLLGEANRMVLNRHRQWVTNLRGAGFPRTTPQPSRLAVSPFP
jgi:hypothetical protein